MWGWCKKFLVLARGTCAMIKSPTQMEERIMRFGKILGAVALGAAVLCSTGCAHMSEREFWGTAAGALVGGVIGDLACSGDGFCTTTGAAIGGAVGYTSTRRTYGGYYYNGRYVGRGGYYRHPAYRPYTPYWD